jgi:alpha-D-xyloside xylohydrolase
MKTTFHLLLIFVFFSCSNSGYQKTNNGVIIPVKSTNEKIRLKVYNNEIVRVTVSKPGKSIIDEESLITNMVPEKNTKWDIQQSGESVVLSTEKIKADISTLTGEVKFLDQKGNVILREQDGGGRYYGKAIDEGQSENAFQEIFESSDDEAFYGLGAHQNGEVNYKGLDVELMQHNIVDVVPFLYSNKNYGLLWDNYSITRFGDPRDYQEIGKLKLFDADDQPGGLTASYYDKGDHLFLSKTENKINYSNLEEIKNLPEGFNMNPESKVIWEGSIESAIAGKHKFKLYISGYWKVWIDEQLIVDKWRQAWNPWYYKFYIDLQPGQKKKIKIEWTPDSNLSYIGLSFLDPAYNQKQNKLSLCSEAGKQIDYFFIKGENADEVLSGYRNLTGKSPIMPKWAMGLWQSRERYRTQNELLDIVKEYRKREIPFDNIVLDWQYWPEDKWGDHNFDPKFWPDPDKMINELHNNLNSHIMISVWPKFYVGTKNFDLFKKNGWLLMKNVEWGHKDWVGPGYLSTFYDAYNPEAREAFWNGINEKLFSKGIDGWWLDATEPDIHSNVSFEERKSVMTPNYFGTGEEYYNTYSLLQAKGVYEGQRKTDPDKRVFILTRSAFAGQQRYAAATWSGDIVSRWDDLRDQIAAGINMGLSGIPYWTTDIGGFSVERRYEKPTAEDLKEWREINTRWYQFGVFCPLFRIHGQFPYREIFNLAPENSTEFKSMVYYDQLRYRLMPYIYSLAASTYHDNAVIMRGLVMDSGTDPNVNNISDQFMFGKAFMVCPVGFYEIRERNVYLPSTSGWYDFYSGKFYEGGNTIKASAPLEIVPLFVKEGSIIPFGPEIQYTMQPTEGMLKILVYTGKDVSFNLYEDEGVNYNYEKGSFSTIPLKYNEADKTFEIGNRAGQFKNMLAEREIQVYFIDRQSEKPFDLKAAADKTFRYNGSAITISKN